MVSCCGYATYERDICLAFADERLVSLRRPSLQSKLAQSLSRRTIVERLNDLNAKSPMTWYLVTRTSLTSVSTSGDDGLVECINNARDEVFILAV